ncbi:F-box and leucine-rich protein 22 [Eublepharis macularius]|uniref:F-box and leucine-rich protein 22 n=1 Tax=Eublepharis macularius TaxID=481883 RepID=A0AA97KKL3_EUBMA|nr:F-box and leucine-rich protein 22 [Eublepharis macularius]
MHITQLNGECLLHLFSFLDKDSRKNLGQTCHRLLAIFKEPSLWPLLHFHSPSELTKGNFVLGPALRYLSIRWHSSRVKVCNIEDWMKSTFQRAICSRHEHAVSDFLLQVGKRCPNLLALSLSGCGHVTDRSVGLLLQSCPCLKTLQLENCVRITDQMLEAAILHAYSLQTLHVDFCRNISQAGLQRFRAKRPAVTLKAERSADMIPDKEPGSNWMSERGAKKLMWY